MIAKILGWIQKNLRVLLAFAVVCGAAGTAVWWDHARAERRFAEVGKKLQQYVRAYGELKKKYTDLEADRNNVLAQTKSLLQEKSKWADVQEQLDNLQKNYDIVMSQKDKIHAENQKLKQETASVLQNFDKLKDAYKNLDESHRQLTAQAKTLEIALNKKVEESPQYRQVSKQARDLTVERQKLNAAIKALDDKLKRSLDQIKKMQARDTKFSKQIQSYKAAFDSLQTERNALAQTNQQLNKAVDEAPARFRDMAQENKGLIKETAQMHYNMGVFFTQNKDYPMAVKEFKRAVQIDPSNAKAYYNLGYIYAEEFEHHDEAMAQFQRFLELSPNSPESEAIRGYMVVRQAYGDKVAKK